MSKTRTERITAIEEQIKQMENRKKQLLQQERAANNKARTRRLCERHGLLESLLPETISLTKEQYRAFVEKVLSNGYAKKVIAGILADSEKAAIDEAVVTSEEEAVGEATEKVNTSPPPSTPKATESPQPNTAGGKTTQQGGKPGKAG